VLCRVKAKSPSVQAVLVHARLATHPRRPAAASVRPFIDAMGATLSSPGLSHLTQQTAASASELLLSRVNHPSMRWLCNQVR
jgi:hypothetical protein